jgi:hypothetical protein
MAGVPHLLPYYIVIYFPRSKRNWAFILSLLFIYLFILIFYYWAVQGGNTYYFICVGNFIQHLLI